MYETLGISGNRPHKLPGNRIGEVKNRLTSAMFKFKKQGGERLIQGGALGVDTWAGLAALKAGLELYTYIPFPQQAEGWREDDLKEYYYLLNNSTFVKTFGESRSNSLYFVRNRAIVDDSDIMMAVSSPAKDGGTIRTAEYTLYKEKALTKITVFPDHLEEKFYKPATSLFD